MSITPVYRIAKHDSETPLFLNNDAAWKTAQAVNIDCFRPESKDHKPSTSVTLKYTDTAIHGLFRVNDRYVRCVHKGTGTAVYNDSCVEFFVKPLPDRGYFNFEFNCGGSMLASYITNPQRVPGGFKEYKILTPQDCADVAVEHTMPETVEPEIIEPVEWKLGFAIPFTLFEKYAGAIKHSKGCEWRANFNKCGDKTSHPHWATWSPVTSLNFHLPQCFGRIIFD
jgi:hypothetical protein